MSFLCSFEWVHVEFFFRLTLLGVPVDSLIKPSTSDSKNDHDETLTTLTTTNDNDSSTHCFDSRRWIVSTLVVSVFSPSSQFGWELSDVPKRDWSGEKAQRTSLRPCQAFCPRGQGAILSIIDSD